MSELLNGIFECLDINSSTGLATKDSLQNMTPFQRLFYTQVHEKIGIDAVYFLRDANGIAKVPLLLFNQTYNIFQQSTKFNLGQLDIPHLTRIELPIGSFGLPIAISTQLGE